MNSEIKQKWVEALRSGQYRKGRFQLKNNNDFCCLGVLCDLYSKEKNIEWKLCSCKVCFSFEDKTTFLPKSVVEWAGLEEEDPFVRHPDILGKKHLSDINDNFATNFNFIADIIEKEL